MSATKTAPAQKMRMLKIMRTVFPSWTVALLVAIGTVDLISTAMLHANGQIVELNPLMRFFIIRSEWLFAFVKGLTIGAAWGALAWYAKQNLEFVKKAASWACCAYLSVWLVWFTAAA
jgi:hypothetical protein